MREQELKHVDAGAATPKIEGPVADCVSCAEAFKLVAVGRAEDNDRMLHCASRCAVAHSRWLQSLGVSNR